MIDFKKKLDKDFNHPVDLLKQLVAIPSVLDESKKTEEAPFGPEIYRALCFMRDEANQSGFETHQDGGYALDIRYGNESGKKIGILCHLDVVPAGNNWSYDPFVATIVGDKMYGRGTTDDKGPSVAAYYALKMIKDAGIKLKNQVRMIFGCDEETAWRGVHHYFENYSMPEIGFAPDSSFPLIYGEKGRFAIDIAQDHWDDSDPLVSFDGGERYNVVLDKVVAVLTIDVSNEFKEYLKENNLKGSVQKVNNQYEYCLEGLAAHAMEPEKGINAGTYLAHFLVQYSSNPMLHYVNDYHHLDTTCTKLGLAYEDHEMGPITCNIGIMHLSKESTRLTLDLRYPVRYDVEKFHQVLPIVLAKYSLHITNFDEHGVHYVSPDNELVQKLYASYVKYTGDTTNKPFTVGGGTYAAMLENAVAFGMTMPDEIDLCHQPNEYMSLKTFKTSILIYLDAILSLGEIDA
jgi:succinyl-diaminopimelate desuccinylase